MNCCCLPTDIPKSTDCNATKVAVSNYSFRDGKCYVDGKYYGFIQTIDEVNKTIQVKCDNDNIYLKGQIIIFHLNNYIP